MMVAKNYECHSLFYVMDLKLDFADFLMTFYFELPRDLTEFFDESFNGLLQFLCKNSKLLPPSNISLRILWGIFRNCFGILTDFVRKRYL
jgi:hypothetical protein